MTRHKYVKNSSMSIEMNLMSFDNVLRQSRAKNVVNELYSLSEYVFVCVPCVYRVYRRRRRFDRPVSNEKTRSVEGLKVAVIKLVVANV